MDEGKKLFLKFGDILHGNCHGQYASSDVDFSKIFPKSATIHSRIRSLKKYLEKMRELVKSCKDDEDGMCLLLDGGLSDLIVESLALFGDVAHLEGVTVLLDELLDIVNVTADTGQKVQTNLVTSVCGPYLQLIVADSCSLLQKTEIIDDLKIYHTRLICRSLNVLLETCPFATKETVLKQQNFIHKLENLFQLIINIGDYESQIGILECIFRLVPKKIRTQYASMFIPRTSLDAFLDICDVSFETDCRIFLNELNRSVGKSKRVYSIPCEKAILGKKELKKPSDEEYTEFWVDFNYGTRRITLFCEQDVMEVASQDHVGGILRSYSLKTARHMTPLSKLSNFCFLPGFDFDTTLDMPESQESGLWETVSVSLGDVKAYSYKEESDMSVAFIELKKDISAVYKNMRQCSGTGFELIVPVKYNMKKALMTILGSEKCKIRKVSTVITPVQLKDEKDCHYQVSPPGRIMKKKTLQSTLTSDSQRNNEHITAVRKKISVPSVPMSTPARCVTSPLSTNTDTTSFSSPKSVKLIGSAPKKEKNHICGSSNSKPQDKFIVTRTPVIKVKTPVVEVRECLKKVRGKKKNKKLEHKQGDVDTGCEVVAEKSDQEGRNDGKKTKEDPPMESNRSTQMQQRKNSKKCSSHKLLKQKSQAISSEIKTTEDPCQVKKESEANENTDNTKSSSSHEPVEITVIQESQDVISQNSQCEKVSYYDSGSENQPEKNRSLGSRVNTSEVHKGKEDSGFSSCTTRQSKKPSRNEGKCETNSDLSRNGSADFADIGDDITQLAQSEISAKIGKIESPLLKGKTRLNASASTNSTNNNKNSCSCDASKEGTVISGIKTSEQKQQNERSCTDRCYPESHKGHNISRCVSSTEDHYKDIVKNKYKTCRNKSVLENSPKISSSSVECQEENNVSENIRIDCHISMKKMEMSESKQKQEQKLKQVNSRKNSEKRVLPSRKAKENQIYNEEIDISDNCEFLFQSPRHKVNKEQISVLKSVNTYHKVGMKASIDSKNSNKLLSLSGLYFPELSRTSTDSDPYDFDAECDKYSNLNIDANMPCDSVHQKGKKRAGISASESFKHKSENRKQNRSAETIAAGYMKSWHQKLNKKKGKTHVLSRNLASWKTLSGQYINSDEFPPQEGVWEKKKSRLKQAHMKGTSAYSASGVTSASIVETRRKVEENFVVASRSRDKTSKFRLFNPDLSVLMSTEETATEILKYDNFPENLGFNELEKVNFCDMKAEKTDLPKETLKKQNQSKKQLHGKLNTLTEEIETIASHTNCHGNRICENDVIENFSAVCKSLIEQSSVRDDAFENDTNSDAEKSEKTVQQMKEYSGDEEQKEDTALTYDQKSELSWVAKKSAAKKRKNMKTYKRQQTLKEKRDEMSDIESDIEELRFRDMEDDHLVMSSQEWEAPTTFGSGRAASPNIILADTPKFPSSKKRYSPLDVKIISATKTPKTPVSYHFSDEEDELYIEEAEPVKLVPLDKKLEVFKEYSPPLNDEKVKAHSSHIQSGPSSTIRASQSSLKRKYSHLNLEDDQVSEEESSEKIVDESDRGETAETVFFPRKLFRIDNIPENKKESEEQQGTPPLKLAVQKVRPPKQKGFTPSLQSPSVHLTTTEDNLCMQFGDIDPALDFGSDIGIESGISTIVQAFGIDIQKQLQAKYQQLREITKGALKNTQKHINQIWSDEYHSRGRAMEHFKDKMLEELLALEVDVTALIDAEDKSLAFCEQQKKAMERHRTSQETRLRNLKLLFSSLEIGLRETEDRALHKQQNLKNIMKKDLSALQKRLLSQSPAAATARSIPSLQTDCSVADSSILAQSQNIQPDHQYLLNNIVIDVFDLFVAMENINSVQAIV